MTVKTGATETVGRNGVYSLISFKLFDAGKIDKVTLNGVVKDLTDNTWSDVNFIKPGVFGAVQESAVYRLVATSYELVIEGESYRRRQRPHLTGRNTATG